MNCPNGCTIDTIYDGKRVVIDAPLVHHTDGYVYCVKCDYCECQECQTSRLKVVRHKYV